MKSKIAEVLLANPHSSFRMDYLSAELRKINIFPVVGGPSALEPVLEEMVQAAELEEQQFRCGSIRTLHYKITDIGGATYSDRETSSVA